MEQEAVQETPYMAQRRKLRELKGKQEAGTAPPSQISAKAAARRAAEAAAAKPAKKVSKKKSKTTGD